MADLRPNTGKASNDFNDTLPDGEQMRPLGRVPKSADETKVPESLGFKNVFAILDKAFDDSDRSKSVTISDVEIPNPDAALKNLQEALKLLPACVKPDPNDVFFQSLPGNKVGEASAEGTKIDPIMLLHPAHRLAHVIAHETAHRKNTVPNEGLVEVYLRAIGVVEDGPDGPKATEKYDKALAEFSDFLSRMSKGGNSDAIAKEVYNLYYKCEYGKIYEMYNKMHVETLPTGEKDAAVKFFWEIFPELEYDQKGQTRAQSVIKFETPEFAPRA